MNKKRVYVFVKSFADLDNIVPILSYISKKEVEIRVFSFSEKLHGCERHLAYLERVCDIHVCHFDSNIPQLNRKILNFIRILMRFNKKVRNKIISFFLRVFSAKILKPLLFFFSFHATKFFFRGLKDTVILLDVGMEMDAYGRAFIRRAKLENVSVKSYLHGYYIYTNSDNLVKSRRQLGFFKQLADGLQRYKKERLYFDSYLVGNYQKQTWFKSAAMAQFSENESSRIKELGVPRYTREWVKIYRSNIGTEETFNYGSRAKLNVLIFLTHPKYNVNTEALIATMRSLDDLQGINFVYKPHVRNGLDGLDAGKLRGFDAAEVSSVALSEWADIGVVFGGSIGIQLLIDNVPLIVPTFLSSNNTIFQRKKACVEVSNLNQLIGVIEKAKSGTDMLIDSGYVRNFIADVVYGNRTYEKLMGVFYEEIIN